MYGLCLFVFLSVCRYRSLSVSMSVSVSPCQSVSPSLSMSLSICLFLWVFPISLSLLTLPPVLFVIMTSRSCMCNTNHAFGGRVGKRLGGRLFPRRSSEKGVISSVTWTPFKMLWTIPYKATQDCIEKKGPSFSSLSHWLIDTIPLSLCENDFNPKGAQLFSQLWSIALSSSCLSAGPLFVYSPKVHSSFKVLFSWCVCLLESRSFKDSESPTDNHCVALHKVQLS